MTATPGTFDAVVIGGGPAGLAAATWLARYRRRTLVVDGGRPRNAATEASHGYLTRDGAAPADLLAAARADLARYGGAEMVDGEVTAVDGVIGDFTVRAADGRSWRALRVVLCTGVEDVFPDVDGFDEHYGASIFHCAACDGYEARGLDVAVLGWGAHVAGFALELLDWARSIVVLTDGHRFEGGRRHRDVLAGHGIQVVERGAAALEGRRGALERVRLDDGSSVAAQIAFFSIAHVSRAALADALGCARTDEGCVAVDETGRTTVPGVYAAGDLVPGYQLIQVAAAKGTTAGVGCARSLRQEPPVPGRPPRAPVVDDALGPVG